jgi:hypothetical protein
VSFKINLHAWDGDSKLYENFEVRPSGSAMLIGAGGKIPLNSFPDVSVDYYNIYNYRYYIVTGTVSYTDLAGKEIEPEKTVFYRVYPDNEGLPPTYQMQVEEIDFGKREQLIKAEREHRQETYKREMEFRAGKKTDS